MSAFDRLTPALQYQITQTLGFTSLRPVQEMTIEHVLDGRNCVVLAPTAGGKTEAAFFPVLSMIDARDSKPVSVLYTSPIRALLNNQEERVSRYAQTIGRRAFKWHGDVGPTERQRFLKDPADILLTTPESLEVMLMSPNIPAHQLFRGLEVVIIDEVHAFADDDRGAHLSALLERLSRYCGRDIQRIGLSATVGNPQEILEWLRGKSKREGVVVSPPKQPKAPDISLRWVEDVERAADDAAGLHPGKKRLIFVDSRRGCEEFAKHLTARGVDTYVLHGSLAPTVRRESEKAFAEGQNCVIVATSALELGIDVGDLDHVLQIDSPRSVASFLQRMGRTGRRHGTTPNCTFLVTKPAMLLQAAALLRLHAQGFVEDVRPTRRASHILAHQLMALCIQEQGISAGDWWAWLDGAIPFSAMSAEDRQGVIAHMRERGILADQGGRLWLGPEGEKRYGRANFRELYAVFSVPRAVVILWGAEEVGTIDSSFLEVLEEKDEPSRFVLGGRPWEVQSIDWKRGRCSVVPVQGAAKPARWLGGGTPLSFELCQAMRDVLISDERDTSWTDETAVRMHAMRGEYEFLRDGEIIREDPAGVTWWSFAGGRANLLLARMIESDLGGSCSVKNTSLTWKNKDGSKEAIRDWVYRMLDEGRPNRKDAVFFAPAAGSRRLTKFEPCLPRDLLLELVVDRALDPQGAARAAEQAAGRRGRTVGTTEEPIVITLRAPPDSERESPAIALAAQGRWAELPDNLSVHELNVIAHLVNGYEIAAGCGLDEPGALAERFRAGPEALDAASIAELFAAFFGAVRGWRGLYEFPTDGDQHHREALALFAALRRALRERPDSVRFAREDDVAF